MKKTLVIMAAGIGSRFGGGIKQLEPVGPNGEIIMDYSVHDAIAAGFNKIIFIIRHDIEADFKEVIGDRIEAACAPLGVEVAYAFQEKDLMPPGVPTEVEGRLLDDLMIERTKPWGTGHAVLACDGLIDGPFAVINADDYYGKEGFRKAAEFLEAAGSADDSSNKAAGSGYGLVGYILKNTLSDNGGVTRGICRVSENGQLIGIDETKEIVKVVKGTGDSMNEEIAAESNGEPKTEIAAESNGEPIDINSLVSMNFWCYPAAFMDVLRKGFPEFLSEMRDPLKDEYLLPTIVDELLRQGTDVTVIPTDDQWFGVTYKEDKASVVESFRSLYEQGVYKSELYSDL